MSDSRTGPAPSNNANAAHLTGEALSVREAARIKGVSYSTTLRAIRAGRLPSRRVGRTLLILPTDLDRWEPGRSAGATVTRTTTNGTTPSTTRETKLLARMVWLAGLPMNDRDGSTLETICERLVADLDLLSASVWSLGRSGQRFTPFALSGPIDAASAEGISLRETGAALTMLRPGLQEVDGEILFPAGDRRRAWCVVAPIRAERQLTGLIILASENDWAALPEDERQWAELLVTILASDLLGQQRQSLDEARTRQLQTVIDALPEAAAVADGSARILVANRAFRGQFGLLPESLEIGVDLAALLGQVEQLNDAAGKRSVVPRLRAALDAADATTLPLALAPAGERGIDRLVITPIDAPGETDEGSRASLIRIVSPPTPTGAPQPSDRCSVASPESDRSAGTVIEIDRVIDFVTALGAGEHLNEVLQAGVDELRDIFGASAGSIVLRRADGMLVRLSPSGFEAATVLDTLVDPARLPSAQTAMRERRAVVLRRSTANVHETEALDRAGVDGGLIIPLLVGDRAIGLAVLAFFADPDGVTLEQAELAAGLGRYLASAISNARNWDRWGVAQRHLLTVIDQLPQGVVVVDAADGSLLVANRAAGALWGTEFHGSADTDDVTALGDAVQDQGAAQLTASRMTVHGANGDPFPEGETPMGQTLRLGERRLGEPLTVVRSDGTTVRVIGNHVPILAADGRILSAVGVFQDIEQLREVDRAKDEFLSVVAHELRNPLTSLRGNMQLLQRRLGRMGDATQADDLTRLDGLIAQTDRINHLVGRLLDVSRADFDRITLECDRCDGAVIVAQAVETARGQATTAHILVAVLPDELPVVWDHVRIAQVLDNLLSNALKYALPGEIRVSLRAVEEGQVEITVMDEGPGMSDAVRARVFERYYRAAGNSSGPDGLGIGLYISSRIAAAHHGRISVADAPGGGSVFTVRLPLDATHP